jgi:Zn-dependent protease with chaperone function
MAEPRTGRALDERTLFAGTTVRFAQMLVLMLVASAGLTMEVAYGFGNDALNGCLLAAGIDFDRPWSGMHVVYGTHSGAWESCIDRYMFAPPGWFGLAWAALVAASAAGLFRVLPVWKSKRRDVVTLGENETDADGSVRARLEALKTRAGLESVPVTLVDRTAPTASAVVFGSDRRPVLRLDAGLIAVQAEEPARFDAVILHEFAHIRARDITITYATVALWRAFVALVLAPYTVSYLIGIPGAFGQVWQSAALLLLAQGLLHAVLLTALVYLARADVLRTREFCADIAAQDAGSEPHGWTAATIVEDEGRLRRWWGSFAVLWRVHPPKNLRRHTLAHPAVLFEVHAVPLLLTGAVAVITAEQMSTGLRIYRSWLDPVASVTAAGLIAGVTGIALWRAVAGPPPAGKRRPTGVRAGLWLGVGMAVGALPAAGAGLEAIPAHPEFLLLMVLAGVGCCWWTTQCADAWITARGKAGPLGMSLVLAGAWMVLSAWLEWWRHNGALLATGVLYDSSYVRSVTTTPLASEMDQVYVAVVRFYDFVEPVWTGFRFSAITWPAVAVLWALPLLAWTVVRDSGRLPRLRRMLLPALLGAVSCWAAVAAGLAYMSPWVGFGQHHLISYIMLVSAGLVMGAAVTALAASLLADRLRLVQVFIAVHLATLAGFGGVVALMSADGCLPPLAASQVACGDFPLLTFLLLYEQIVPHALVFAAVAAFAVTAIVAAILRLREPKRHHASTTASPYVKRLAIGMLCGAAAGFVVVAMVLQPRVPAEPTVSEDVPTPVVAAVAPAVKAAQIEAWRDYGGGDLIADFETALAEAAALAEAFKEADVDLAAARSVCAAVTTAADGADVFFPVPDAPTQEQWTAFTARARDASLHCEQAADRRNLSMLDDALQDLLDTSAALGATIARLDDLQYP